MAVTPSPQRVRPNDNDTSRPRERSGVVWWHSALWILAVCAVGVVYFLIDPAEARWMPQCPVHMLTGLQCPGCGAQRLIHALLHGDIVGAWHANAFLLLALPGIGFLGWLELTRRRHARLYARVYSTPVIISIGIILIVWGLGRNLLGI